MARSAPAMLTGWLQRLGKRIPVPPGTLPTNASHRGETRRRKSHAGVGRDHPKGNRHDPDQQRASMIGWKNPLSSGAIHRVPSSPAWVASSLSSTRVQAR